VSRLTVEDLLARAEIVDVLNRYVRGVDRADAELIRSCYHPGAIDDHGTFRGPADEFADHVAGERAHRYVSTMHFLAPPNIEVEGAAARVDTYCTAHHVTVPDEAGEQRRIVMGVRYLDRFELQAGRWLIAHRRCAFDWAQTLPGTGGLPEAVTRGTRDRSDPWYGDF
jgi:SnoaL-like domain